MIYKKIGKLALDPFDSFPVYHEHKVIHQSAVSIASFDHKTYLRGRSLYLYSV